MLNTLGPQILSPLKPENWFLMWLPAFGLNSSSQLRPVSRVDTEQRRQRYALSLWPSHSMHPAWSFEHYSQETCRATSAQGSLESYCRFKILEPTQRLIICMGMGILILNLTLLTLPTDSESKPSTFYFTFQKTKHICTVRYKKWNGSSIAALSLTFCSVGKWGSGPI